MASKIQSFGGLFVQCVCLALLCENVNASGDRNNRNRKGKAVKIEPTETTSGRRMSAEEARRTVFIA